MALDAGPPHGGPVVQFQKACGRRRAMMFSRSVIPHSIGTAGIPTRQAHPDFALARRAIKLSADAATRAPGLVFASFQMTASASVGPTRPEAENARRVLAPSRDRHYE